MDLEKIVREEVKELLKEKLFNKEVKEEKVEEINQAVPAAEGVTQPTNTMM